MKEKILKTILVSLLLITMTMANFILLGVNAYTYAAENVGQDRITNNKNIEFMAYFKNEKGDMLSKQEVNMNANNLKLYFKILVKQEGYFNGNVTISNANFRVLGENSNKEISKIEGNKIYLNQINAGEEKEFEIGIELLKDDKYPLDMLAKDAEVLLGGVYRDSREKDINVNAVRKLNLKLNEPYSGNTDSPVLLEQKVITNKAYEEEGTKRRIVQMQINTGLIDNLYPIKNVKLEINVPKINSVNPKKVEVITPETLMLTGNKIDNAQYNYDEKNGKLMINIENVEQDGKVNWFKQGLDKYVVTYIFEGEEALTEQKVTTKATYNLYNANNSRYSMEIEKTVLADELDSIVELKVDSSEKEIYKGKIYSNIDREVTQNLYVQVNAQGIANSVKVVEDFKQTKLNVQSKELRVNKDEFLEILGQNGKIAILEKTTNKVLAEMNNSSQVDENGYIVTKVPENTKELVFEISKPEKIGVLNIEKINVVKATGKDSVKTIKELPYGVNGTYLIGDVENKIKMAENKILLKESETISRLEINKEELSTMVVNKNVEMKVILENANESRDLYKNPVIKIQLPEKIKEVKLNSVNLLNEDELKIKNTRLNGKTLEIELQNEQTKYKNETVEGAVIVVSMDLTLDRKEKNSTEQIKLSYKNEKANSYKNGAFLGEEIKNINIVSYSGLITVNSVPEYGIETVNASGVKSARLLLDEKSKKVVIKSQIINNEAKEVRNVQILGTFPTKDSVNENNIDMLVSELRIKGVANERIKVYYTENQNANKQLDNAENAWKEKISDASKVKKYLIVIDKLDIGEDFNFEYDMTIPNNLEYNKVSKQGYNIYYTLVGTELEQIKENEMITLETGSGPVVEAEIRATVGGETSNKAKKGEFIHYELVAKNMGTEKVSNIKLVGNVPEGTVFIEEQRQTENQDIIDNMGFKEDKDKKIVEFNIENLDIGQQVVKEYDVKVINSSAKNVENKVKMQYGQIVKESSIATTIIEDGDISASIWSSEDAGEVVSNCGYRFVLSVTNTSGKQKKKVKVSPKVENLKIIEAFSQIKNQNGEFELKNYTDLSQFVIDKIDPGETVDIAMRVIVDDFKDSEEKYIALKANVMVDDDVYRTNLKKVKAKGILLNISNTSPNDGGYVKAGDEIVYKVLVSNRGEKKLEGIKIEDTISNYETFRSISYNGKELNENEFKTNQDIEGKGKTIEVDTDLDGMASKEYTIKTVVNRILGNSEILEFSNIAKVSIIGVEKGFSEVKHILEPEKEIQPIDPDKPVNPDEGGNEGATSKIISGVAWLDKNDNSERDDNDELLKDITVKLFDVKNNKFFEDKTGRVLETKTNDSGFYSLTGIPQGEYIVVFEYDISKYGLVEYKKSGVSEKNNSDVINKKLDISGISQDFGITEVIKINDSSIANINIGLKELKVFDMKLDKYVSRIVVNNSNGVRTYELGETTLGKADINAKQINKTNVVVEYKIKVTNEGEIPGYVKKIEDNVAKDYKFSSEMNKNWYKSGETLENVSLANTKINPGESKEITLILTKQMTENNTGLINNTAEIAEAYNEQGIKDRDSIPGNKVKEEDDMGSADVILSIKTGEIVMVVVTIITLIAILSVSAYFIIKMILKKKGV